MYNDAIRWWPYDGPPHTECEMLDTDRGAGALGPTTRATDPRGRGWSGAWLLRRTPAPVRVLFIALLGAAAIGIYLAFLRQQVPVTPPIVRRVAGRAPAPTLATQPA